MSREEPKLLHDTLKKKISYARSLRGEWGCYASCRSVLHKGSVGERLGHSVLIVFL